MNVRAAALLAAVGAFLTTVIQAMSLPKVTPRSLLVTHGTAIGIVCQLAAASYLLFFIALALEQRRKGDAGGRLRLATLLVIVGASLPVLFGALSYTPAGDQFFATHQVLVRTVGILVSATYLLFFIALGSELDAKGTPTGSLDGVTTLALIVASLSVGFGIADFVIMNNDASFRNAKAFGMLRTSVAASLLLFFSTVCLPNEQLSFLSRLFSGTPSSSESQ